MEAGVDISEIQNCEGRAVRNGNAQQAFSVPATVSSTGRQAESEQTTRLTGRI